MILVKDDFLPNFIFNKLHYYAKETEYKVIQAGDKGFLTIPTPKDILPYLQIDEHSLFLSFIRKAHKDYDTDLRIHADNIILNKKAVLASVLYLNKNDENITKNGTAFYRHLDYGYKLDENNEKDFDFILENHSNNHRFWERTDFVSSKENRLLMYNADYFHSKYPARIDKGERIVLVNFYTKN